MRKVVVETKGEETKNERKETWTQRYDIEREHSEALPNHHHHHHQPATAVAAPAQAVYSIILLYSHLFTIFFFIDPNSAATRNVFFFYFVFGCCCVNDSSVNVRASFCAFKLLIWINVWHEWGRQGTLNRIIIKSMNETKTNER